MEQVFREVCQVPVDDDGRVFDLESIELTEIREQRDYGGTRVALTVFLGKARVPVQIDVGFGDAVTPGVEEIEFGGLLGFPPARVRAYPRETVVAEKLEAVVSLGMLNSRMKDFYDLYQLSREFSFDGRVLSRAISATFRRRGTAVPAQLPVALSSEFCESREKQAQWAGFARKLQLSGGEVGLAEACTHLERFVMPLLRAAAQGASFEDAWAPGGPWSSESEVHNRM